jgi:hypothetical protein
MSPFSIVKENVDHEGIDHSMKKLFLLSFPLKEENMINYTLSIEIIVDTLHHEMIFMPGSQTMTLVLCQVEPYPFLEENDEHIEKKISVTFLFLFHLLKIMRR